ncbi:hypothetical protein MPLSOD_260031 [Mesorhizobium sp. SOD10]|nr:hypothetical protein MPLSOD_260031 [Mesorhizobium sp. SOD10]
MPPSRLLSLTSLRLSPPPLGRRLDRVFPRPDRDGTHVTTAAGCADEKAIADLIAQFRLQTGRHATVAAGDWPPDGWLLPGTRSGADRKEVEWLIRSRKPICASESCTNWAS